TASIIRFVPAGFSDPRVTPDDSVSSLPASRASPVSTEEKSSSIWIFCCLSSVRLIAYWPLLLVRAFGHRSRLGLSVAPPFGFRSASLALPTSSPVGTEWSALLAGHHPPPILYMQFSRIQLSRRLTLPRCNRRNQLDQVHQPVLAVQLGFRQLSPATVPPTLEPMRPNTSHNPAVASVEELSDVSSLV